MSLNIGIVGAENSHTVAIAKLINIDKKVPGIRVTHVWGETKKLALKASEIGHIPNIVTDPSEMIGEIQGEKKKKMCIASNPVLMPILWVR